MAGERTARKSIRQKARERDGGIGKLATPGVFYTVTHWNWPNERVIARRPKPKV